MGQFAGQWQVEQCLCSLARRHKLLRCHRTVVSEPGHEVEDIIAAASSAGLDPRGQCGVQASLARPRKIGPQDFTEHGMTQPDYRAFAVTIQDDKPPFFKILYRWVFENGR